MIDDRLKAASADLHDLLGTPSPPQLPRRGTHGRAFALVAAVGVVAAGAVAISTGDHTTNSVTVTPSVATSSISDPTSSAPDTSSPTTLGETTTTTSASEHSHLQTPLSQGSTGDQVSQLQTRLTALGFAPGAIDGVFGDLTTQAVWAYEKLVEQVPAAEATGIVTDGMWQEMQSNIRVEPLRPGAGTHVEVYLPQQVAAVFTDNIAILVMHISSGAALDRDDPPSWCEMTTINTDDNGEPIDPPRTQSVCGRSFTPGGVFHVDHAIAGQRLGALGTMLDPVYFNYGIAIYGSHNVPLHPASRGGVRIAQALSTTLLDAVHIGDLVYVWGQNGMQPEDYTKAESTPIFSYPNPDADGQTKMPLLTGLLLQNALDLLDEVGLTADPITSQPSADVNVGRVVGQAIPVGQIVATGTAVEIVVGTAE